MTDPAHMQLIEQIRLDLEDCESVVELGAGEGQVLSKLTQKERLGVEIFEPYRNFWLAEPDEWRLSNAAIWIGGEGENRYDAVLMIDFIEHLPRDMGESVLEQSLRVAKKKVVVFSPEGWQTQTPEGVKNAGKHPRLLNEYQRHLSAWSVKDFPGWNVVKLHRSPRSFYVVSP